MLQISKRDAADIVDQLSTLINLKINIVGSDSIIIANSDRERVGDFHEATDYIIKNNLDELVAMNDNQFVGTHSGTNLPLVIDRQIIGVVGITGPYKQARAYGQIIKKMTEILIQGKERENLISKFRQDRERFETNWVCNSQTVMTSSFMTKGQELKLDITVPRRVMIISIRNSSKEDSLKESCMFEIQKQSPDNIVFENLNVLIVLLHNRTDKKMEHFANKILEKFADKDTKIYIGIDEGYSDFLKINDQYSKAMKALISCSHMGRKSICFYNDLNIELVLEEIPLGIKQLYIDKIFKGFSKEEIENAIKVIKVFYEEDGSIKRASEKLNIHSNTLQYKLKRIKTRTGYDPRKLKFAATFSLVDLFLFEIGNL